MPMSRVRLNQVGNKVENADGNANANANDGASQEAGEIINGVALDGYRTDLACIMLKEAIVEKVNPLVIENGAFANLESILHLVRPNPGFAKEVEAMTVLVEGERVLEDFCSNQYHQPIRDAANAREKRIDEQAAVALWMMLRRQFYGVAFRQGVMNLEMIGELVAANRRHARLAATMLGMVAAAADLYMFCSDVENMA